MAGSRIAVSLVSVIAVARIAAADSSGWAVTPLIGTNVGLDFSGGVQVEAPFRLRLMATVGWLPEPYAWLFKRYYVDAYDGREAVGNLIKDTLQNSLVVNTNLTLRPLRRRGAFIGGVYYWTHSNTNDVFAGEIENAIRDRFPLLASAVTVRTFHADVTTQMAGVLAGWQWGLGRGLMLRLSVGIVEIFSVDATFTPNTRVPTKAVTGRLRAAGEEVLEDAVTGVVAPMADLYLGYTFK